MITMPTGTGKSGVIAWSLVMLPELKGHRLVLAPWTALTNQLVEDIGERFWTRLKPSARPTKTPPIQRLPSSTRIGKLATVREPTIFVATIAAISKLYGICNEAGTAIADVFKGFDCVVVDEGHYEPAERWSQAIRALELPTVLLTATPYRNDLKYFEVGDQRDRFPHHEAEKARFLRKPEFRVIGASNETSFARQLRDLVAAEFRAEDTVKVIVRCGDAATIRSVVAALKALGESAVGIHENFRGETGDLTADVPHRDSPGAARYWVHQFKLIEGIDNPEFKVVALYDSLRNGRAIVQQIGRVLRNPSRSKGDMKALVVGTGDRDLEAVWRAYMRFDSSPDAESAATKSDLVERLIEAQPVAFYLDGDYRVRVDLTSPSAWELFAFPLRVRVFRSIEATIPTIQALTDATVRAWDALDRTIYAIQRPDDKTTIVPYVSADNSRLLRTGTFIEPQFGYTCLRVSGDLLFIYDARGRIPPAVAESFVPLPASELKRLFPKDAGLTAVSLRNTDIGKQAARSRRLRAAAVDDLAPDLSDYGYVCTTAEGIVHGARRYVGLSRARVTDYRSTEEDFATYREWLDNVEQQVRGAGSTTPTFSRYATHATVPTDPTPVHVLLDIDPTDYAKKKGAKKVSLNVEDTAYNVVSGAFEIQVGEVGYPSTLTWTGKSYELSSTLEHQRYLENVEDGREIVHAINEDQLLRVVPAQPGIVYSHREFFVPRGLKAAAEILSILTPVPALAGTASEKGAGSQGGDWDANSIFGMISALAGTKIHYVRTSPCPTLGQHPCSDYLHAVFEADSTDTEFLKSSISYNDTTLQWDLVLSNGTTYVFGDNGPLLSITNRLGDRVTIDHDDGLISKITATGGRMIEFAHDSANCPTCISQATDQAGRSVSYTYDTDQRLTSVEDVNGGTTAYGWNNASGKTDQILTVEDPNSTTFLTNTYDSSDRIHTQTLGDSGEYQFTYTESMGAVVHTDVEDPNGNTTRYVFDSDGNVSSQTAAYGTADARTTSYDRDPTTGAVTSTTDQRGRETDYTYNSYGQPTEITQLAGTGDAVSTDYTYDGPFHQLSSQTDPLTQTTSYAYNDKGELDTITDARSHTWAYTWDGDHIATVTDPLNHTSTFGYTLGDPTSFTNPNGDTTSQFVDNAGATVATTDADGLTTSATYDAANDLLTSTDPAGNQTSYTYDGNGNVLTVTDPDSNVSTYTYDPMNRVATYTDSAPTPHTETTTWDGNGNLLTDTDRDGHETAYTYDDLDRPTEITYGKSGASYQFKVDQTWDDGNRITEITDSTTSAPSATIDYTYDGLDQVLTETTTKAGAGSPRGTITYTYDPAGNPETTTVSGQDEIDYTYNPDNQLTEIDQDTASVQLGYNAAGQQTSTSLPDGIQEAYTLDPAGATTAITYTHSATTLGAINYTNGPDGRQIAEDGSYARITLPQTFTGSYNSANQLTSYTQNGGSPTSLSYDNNGQLTGDGTNTYTWNDRQELTAITGGSPTASFTYDPLGRRSSATFAATTTQYLYDSDTVVQEQDGSSTPTVNYLANPSSGATYTRDDGSNVQDLLTDIRGSTIALASSSGTVATSYTYDPFGNPTTTGTASANTHQYINRELDPTSLVYDGARYYSPTTNRFISQDPAGLSGDPNANLYAYSGDDPINYLDPSGNGPEVAALALCVDVPTCIAASVLAGTGVLVVYGAYYLGGELSQYLNHIKSTNGTAVRPPSDNLNAKNSDEDSGESLTPRDIHGKLGDDVDEEEVIRDGEVYHQGNRLVYVRDNGDGTSDVVIRDPSNPKDNGVITTIKDVPQRQVDARIKSGRWRDYR